MNSFLPSIICLYFMLLAIGVLTFGVSSDALAIALAIIGAALAISLPITFEMRSQIGNMTRMNNFLTRTALSQVDEKVAILYAYINNVKNWQRDDNKKVEPKVLLMLLKLLLLAISSCSCIR
jgi:hypothetical protein